MESKSSFREPEKHIGCHTPIVCLTAHTFEEGRKKCLGAGADGCLYKPLKLEELYRTIKRYGR